MEVCAKSTPPAMQTMQNTTGCWESCADKSFPLILFLGALKYGQCAKDEIDKAIQLDGKLALAFVSRGVGNFYLPSSMGGGLDVALKDFEQGSFYRSENFQKRTSGKA